MQEKFIELLEICLEYLREQQRLIGCIENEPHREKELREVLEIAGKDAPEAAEMLQEVLDNLPNENQNNRDALKKLYHSPEHRLIQNLLPADLANEDAIEELISILLMEDASTLKEAIDCLRKKLP